MNATAIKQQPPCPQGNRGCGKTQWMIDRLVEAVVAGQPRSFVVTHSALFGIGHVLPRIAQSLANQGVQIRRVQHDTIDAEGSIVTFVTPEQLTERRRGYRGVGEFWDHHAEGR